MTKLDWGEGRRRFLALRTEIEASLRDGISGRKIWQQHEEQLGLGYRGFSRLVSRYIGDVLPVPIRAAPCRSRTTMSHPEPASSPEAPVAPRETLSAPPSKPPVSRVIFNKSPTAEYLRDRRSRAASKPDS